MQTELFVAAYSSRRALFEEYSHHLEYTLANMLRVRRIRPSAIESRAKTLKSFEEKIARPGKKYVDPLKEMTDLAAVRVVCPDRDSVDMVCELIREQFDVDESNSVDKRRAIDADRFGYASVHLIVRPKLNRTLLPEWQPYRSLPAEIQVRTILAHAWAILSHAAQYKRETEAPVSLVRRLARLAALLEIADEEVATVKRTHEAVTARAVKRASALDFDMVPDVVTLKAYLQSAPAVEQLAELAGHSGGADNFQALAQLFHLGTGTRIETLQRLDEELELALTDGDRLRRFFSDDRIKSFTDDRSQLVLLTLLLRKIHLLDGEWLEKRLNWQKEFIESLSGIIAEIYDAASSNV